MKLKKNKKAVTLPLETVIFLVLNLVFFALMLMFVYQAGNRYFIYEESYAKQIVLLIDNAKPEMAILLDISKVIEIAKKENKPLNEIFSIDENKNIIRVSLGQGSYSYRYFSDYKIDLKYDENWLTINVNKK